MITAPSPAVPAQGRSREPRLPVAAYVLAALIALKAILLLGVVAGATMSTLRVATGLQLNWALAMIRESQVVAWLLLGFAILLLASAVGVVLRRRTGWLLAMALTGLFVAADIYGFLNGAVNHAWMFLNVVTVFYLNQRDVRDAVGASGPAPDDELEPGA
jgi:hypothetical protein